MGRFRINHLHVPVRELRRSMAFYRRHLSLRVKGRYSGLVVVTDGHGFDLALVHTPAGDGTRSRVHFGCRLGSASAVRARAAALRRGRRRFVDPLHVDASGYATFSVADPDGHAVEFYYDPALREPRPRKRLGRVTPG